MAKETTIGGKLYRIGRLTPLQQFHVGRRIAPLKVAQAQAAAGVPEGALEDGAGSDRSGAVGVLLSLVKPSVDFYAQLSDQDAEYVLKTCLSACMRQNDNGSWAPVATPTLNVLQSTIMFADIDYQAQMQLINDVVQENLQSFFPGSPA